MTVRMARSSCHRQHNTRKSQTKFIKAAATAKPKRLERKGKPRYATLAILLAAAEYVSRFGQEEAQTIELLARYTTGNTISTESMSSLLAETAILACVEAAIDNEAARLAIYKDLSNCLKKQDDGDPSAAAIYQHVREAVIAK